MTSTKDCRIGGLGLAACALIFLGVGCGRANETRKSGVEVVLEIDSSKLSSRDQTDIEAVRADVHRSLLHRCVALSLEATVDADVDEFKVFASGATDPEEVADQLSKRLEVAFYDARTVVPGSGINRTYEVGELGTYQGIPAYAFVVSSTGKEIKPGTADYQAIIKSWRHPLLSGDDIEKVEAQPEGSNIVPLITFSKMGAEKMEQWSRRNSGQQSQLACVFNGAVVSIAPLAPGVILSDKAMISGTFEPTYVRQLSALVGAGRLEVDLIVKSKRKL